MFGISSWVFWVFSVFRDYSTIVNPETFAENIKTNQYEYISIIYDKLGYNLLPKVSKNKHIFSNCCRFLAFSIHFFHLDIYFIV